MMQVDGNKVSIKLGAKIAELVTQNAYLEALAEDLQTQLQALQATLEDDYEPKHAATPLEVVADATEAQNIPEEDSVDH